MEFKLRDPDNKDFVEAVVGQKRADELSAHLDKMVKSYGDHRQYVYLKDTMQDIASFCNTPEELAYCIILHMGWHQQRGHILTPR